MHVKEKTTMNNKLTIDSSSVVGFFDSGIGGLTILKKFLPIQAKKYIYVADTAHMPYGDKTLAQIKEYSEYIVRFLISKGATSIIISCHTATALALNHLQNIFSHIPIIGIVDLVSKQATLITNNNHIGIIATIATIKSNAHKKSILGYNSRAFVFEQACPLLASAIEFGTHQGEDLDTLLIHYLHPLLDNNIDTLILGSTHYDSIKDTIDRLTNHKLSLVGAHEYIVQQCNVSNHVDDQQSPFQCYVTGDRDIFLQSSKIVLPLQPYQVEKLDYQSNCYSNLSGRITSSIA